MGLPGGGCKLAAAATDARNECRLHNGPTGSEDLRKRASELVARLKFPSDVAPAEENTNRSRKRRRQAQISTTFNSMSSLASIVLVLFCAIIKLISANNEALIERQQHHSHLPQAPSCHYNHAYHHSSHTHQHRHQPHKPSTRHEPPAHLLASPSFHYDRDNAHTQPTTTTEQRRLNELISVPHSAGVNHDHSAALPSTRANHQPDYQRAPSCANCLAIPLVAIMGEKRLNGYIIPPIRRQPHRAIATSLRKPPHLPSPSPQQQRHIPYVNQSLSNNAEQVVEEVPDDDPRPQRGSNETLLRPKSDEKCPMTGPLTICDQIGSYPADLILEKVESTKRELEGTSHFNIDSLFSDERSHSSEPFEGADELGMSLEQKRKVSHSSNRDATNSGKPQYPADDGFTRGSIAQTEPMNQLGQVNIDADSVRSGYTPETDDNLESDGHYNQQWVPVENFQHHRRTAAPAEVGTDTLTSIGSRATHKPELSVGQVEVSTSMRQAASLRLRNRLLQSSSPAPLNVDDFLTVVQRVAVQLQRKPLGHTSFNRVAAGSSVAKAALAAPESLSGQDKYHKQDRYRVFVSDSEHHHDRDHNVDNGSDDEDNGDNSHQEMLHARAASTSSSRKTSSVQQQTNRGSYLSGSTKQRPIGDRHQRATILARHADAGRVNPIYDEPLLSAASDSSSARADGQQRSYRILADPLLKSDSKRALAIDTATGINIVARSNPKESKRRPRRQVGSGVRVDASSGQLGPSDPPTTTTTSENSAESMPADNNMANQLQAEPVCRANSIYISPKAALNDKKQWKYVVNAPERNPRIRQIVRVDICENPFGPCSDQVSIPFGFTSQCKQKYSKKKLLALDSQSGLLEVDTFFIPSCCVCQLIPDRQPILEGPTTFSSSDSLDRSNKDSSPGLADSEADSSATGSF